MEDSESTSLDHDQGQTGQDLFHKPSWTQTRRCSKLASQCGCRMCLAEHMEMQNWNYDSNQTQNDASSTVSSLSSTSCSSNSVPSVITAATTKTSYSFHPERALRPGDNDLLLSSTDFYALTKMARRGKEEEDYRLAMEAATLAQKIMKEQFARRTRNARATGGRSVVSCPSPTTAASAQKQAQRASRLRTFVTARMGTFSKNLKTIVTMVRKSTSCQHRAALERAKWASCEF